MKAPLGQAYRRWASFENFPALMKHVRSVAKTGDRTSHLVTEGPLGTAVEWDAETTRADENQRIAWNSRDGGDIKTSGQVTFKELPHGETEVTVTLQYVPPARMAGQIVAELFSDPEARLEEDLRNFKAYAEGRNAPASAS